MEVAEQSPKHKISAGTKFEQLVKTSTRGSVLVPAEQFGNPRIKTLTSHSLLSKVVFNKNILFIINKIFIIDNLIKNNKNFIK